MASENYISEPISEPKSEIAQSIRIFKASDINITNPDILKQLIFHIESNILGKLPEIIRFFSHYELIFDIIVQRGNNLGQTCFSSLKTEFEQFQTVFAKDPTKLQRIILSNDRKQYDKFKASMISKEHRIENFKFQLETLVVELKKTFVKSIEHSLRPFDITKLTSKYVTTLKRLNQYINDINIHSQTIPWIIEPNEKTIQVKHKSFMCAASVVDLPQDEFKDYVLNSESIFVHNSTRRYKCIVHKASLDIYINKCFETAFPKIESSTVISLQATCPCTKICGSVCGSIVRIDELVSKHQLESQFKLRILEKKKELIKSIYGVDIFTKCPKLNCPNGDGFPISDVLIELMNGSINSVYSPIHKCNLCDSVWCSNCGKAHPGRLCAEEDDEDLGPNAKKCPKCKLPTTRDGGCFHMNCARCNVHWCWDCNHFTPQSNAYAHNCIKGNWVTDSVAAASESDTTASGSVAAASDSDTTASESDTTSSDSDSTKEDN